MPAPQFGDVISKPEGFEHSDEVAVVAVDIIDTHPAMHSLLDFRLAYLINHANPSADAAGIHAIAKAMKAPPMWRLLSGYDGAVWVQADTWAAMGDRQRHAVVLHELLHFMVDDKGRLAIVHHDVEEFTQVVREYGPWIGGLDAMAEQLRLWEDRGQQPG